MRLTRDTTGADTVCIMSGEYTQRGDIAIADSLTRARWAIYSGAVAVVAIPSVLTTQDAETYATAGIRSAMLAGCDGISFGAEESDLYKLSAVVDILLDGGFTEVVKSNLSRGISYPSAVEQALRETDPSLGYILTAPNNILAVEYLKAIRRLKAPITPTVVKRADRGYHSGTPTHDMLSASGVRHRLETGDDVSDYVPSYVYGDIMDRDLKLMDSRYEMTVMTALHTASLEEIAATPDVTEGLHNRIYELSKLHTSLTDYLDALKTKRYTMARLKRILLNLTFRTTVADVAHAKVTDYARLVAIREDARGMLSEMKPNGIVTCYSDLTDNTLPLWEADRQRQALASTVRGDKVTELNTEFVK